MKKLVFILYITLYIMASAFGQEKYWVLFTDKKNTSFDPYTYFDKHTIEKRLKFNIPLDDLTDYPLNREYVSEVSSYVDSVTSETRWLNGIAVVAKEYQLAHVRKLPYVKEIVPITSTVKLAGNDFDTWLSEDEEKILENQTERMQGSTFLKNNYTGKGIRIAIFDAGFPAVDVSPAFEHIRKEGRIIKTYDFTKKKEFVYSYNPHGTNVMSCIGGMIDGRRIGLATDAEFLLARTEVESEPFSEEENWLAAAEWADKNGADIISSSLGYTNNRYFNFEMDGKTSFVTRAANIAASKGMLVVNAAGNEGDIKWKYIGAPADADSVLSIGGISPESDYHIDFSSFGPTSDKRLKPNVCAYGHVVAAGKTNLHSTYGTSFACPLVAGFAACAWQAKPGINNMELFRDIEMSGDLYPYYDYAHGYGVPQAGWFISEKTENIRPTFRFEDDGDIIRVVVNEDLIVPDDMNYLYYHIADKSGALQYYALISVFQVNAIDISTTDLDPGVIIRVHYKKYTDEFIINK